MGSHRVRLYVYVHTHVYVSNLRKLPNRTQAWDPELVGGGGATTPDAHRRARKTPNSAHTEDCIARAGVSQLGTLQSHWKLCFLKRSQVDLTEVLGGGHVTIVAAPPGLRTHVCVVDVVRAHSQEAPINNEN